MQSIGERNHKGVMELHVVLYLTVVVLSTVPGVYTYNPNCAADLSAYETALGNGEAWALTMYDAHGRREAGVTRGNWIFEGRTDVCDNVNSETNGSLGEPIHGKYCIAQWIFTGNPAGITVCIPQSCNSSDVRQYVEALPLHDWPPGLVFGNGRREWCLDEIAYQPLGDDPPAIGAIAVLCFFGLLGVIGTLYDACTYDKRHPKRQLAGNKNNNARSSRNVYNLDDTGIEGKYNSHHSQMEYHTNPAFDEFSNEGRSNDDGSITLETMTTASVKDNVNASNNINGSPGKTTINGDVISSSPVEFPFYQEEPYKPNTCERIMLCFSVYTNASKLTSTVHPRGSYQALNGIRFFTMAWIVLGHTWGLGVTLTNSAAFQNMFDLFDVFKPHISYQPIEMMDVAVDTFFVLSAMLTTISFLKQLKRHNGKPPCSMFGLYYFHRFWRLTPVYMLILMFTTTIMPHLGSGQLWPWPIPPISSCRTAWWQNLIYLNNFIELDKDCMPWTWYLANDFQFYVIAPAFLSLLFWVPIAGIVMTSLAIAGGLVSLGYLNYQWLMVGGVFHYTEIYIKPWCRCPTYFIGMFLGYILFRKNFKAKMNKVGVGFGWVIALCMITLVFYVPRIPGATESTEATIIHQTLWRSLFACSVSWIIFACITGYGGFINDILSWTGWLPLARLTYTGYLIHPVIIPFVYYTSPVQIYMSYSVMIYYFLGHLMLTLGISFIVSLFLEQPFLALEKIMFQNVKK